MEQKTLRELEKKCIQEEPAECVAACPIHLDARGFVGLVRKKAWGEAWKALRRTMPFPGILGRICDAPCQQRCKRGEAGDPIEIGALERACVSTPPPDFRLPPVVSKAKKVAVCGSGLSSLTVAWDLGRKGYPITIFEPGDSLGGKLKELDSAVLPPDVIEQETTVLQRLGIKVQFQAPRLSEDLLSRYREDFDAVYVGLDAVDASESGLAKNEDGKIKSEFKIQATDQEGVFAGGDSENSADSTVWQAAEGRWAATSIDRFLQNVSVTAAREKDGPYETKLFTNILDVSREPAVKAADPLFGYTEDEAAVEAGRCLQCECLECVKVCPYLAHFKGYPKRYLREIYNNESIVAGVKQANKLINSCSLCGLCERVCPEDFAMQNLCLEARRSMVQRGKMPPSAHEFALLDMEFSQGPRFSMARHEPGMPSSATMFFPGCQLCASSPDKVFQTYAYLREKLDGGVGLMLDCCAAPAFWSGREEPFHEALAALKQKWTDLGEPEIVVACSTCYRMFRDHLKEMPVKSLWETFSEIGLPQGARPPSGDQPLAIHDPCTTRYEPEIRGKVRELLGLAGATSEELPLSGEFTECCGFGGLMQNANPEVARKTVQGRAALSGSDYVTYCGMCRDNLAAAGKRTLHVLDLAFPDLENPDPAAAKRPGWSLRQENRARLKDRFLTELWKEKTPEMEEHRKIRLSISPEVEEILDARRILVEDIQKVVMHAEKTGEKFQNPETGRFKASYKPYKATFWVEYAPAEDGFEIFNAYSHRMEVQKP